MKSSVGWVLATTMLVHAPFAPAADEARELAAKADAAAAAALKAHAASEAAAKAAKEAKDAADAAANAAAAAAAAATAAGHPVTTSPPGVSASAPEPSKEVPGAALSTYLTANSAGGNATIKVEHQIPSSSGNFSYSFALSSPLAKESPYTEPATLDGLANGANLTATFGKFFTRPHDVDTPVWSLGGLARLGYTTFKFYDATSLAKGNAHKYSRTLGPYVGYSPAGAAPIFIVAKYEYQHSFKDTDSKVMCPESATFPVTCVSGPLGEPVENPKRLWSFSLRYSNPRFDLAPMLTYDRVSKAKGIDVPVYFIKASEDTNNTVPFNAGVRLGWRSDTKDYSLGVFVGTPFSFFTP